jgi:hypothetical protein
MKEFRVEITDNIKIDDSLKLVGSLTTHKIFLKEFKLYKEKYLKKEENNDLIMAYILLQLSLENHFHYYLKLVIGGGLGQALPQWSDWAYVPAKLKCFRDSLLQNNFIVNSDDFNKIENYFNNITNIRNKFAHGHPVTETLENNTSTNSETKNYLTRQEFNKTCDEANKLADLWNKIICNLQDQRDPLQITNLPANYVLDECKFKIF